MKRASLLFAGLLSGVLLFAACGGGDGDTPTPTRRPPDTVVATVTSSVPTATPAPTVAPTTAPTTEATTVVNLEITGADDLTFDTDRLSASAGAQVVLTLHNGGAAQQHNWVLVREGDKDAVAADGLTAGAASDWVPPNDDRIVANTRLIAAGQSGEVSFTAPAAGAYEFVCTFPGHNATMFGVFEVTP